jgi:hypothetical protein
MVHELFGFMAAEQLFVSMKSEASAPVNETLLMTSKPEPVLVTFTITGELAVPTSCAAKPMFEGATETPGNAPTPVKGTRCGLPGALSTTLMDAVRLPGAVGLSVTLRLQALPLSRDGGQLLVCLKSVALGPVRLMFEIPSGPSPVFDTVTVCAALVIPTVSVGKFKLPGET